MRVKGHIDAMCDILEMGYLVAVKAICAPLLVAGLATALAGCGPAPAAMPMAEVTPAVPTSTPQPTATAPPTPAPSPTPWLGKLPEGTILLYSTGSPDSRRPYALAAEGSSTDLGRAVTAPALASPSGRRLAFADRAGPALISVDAQPRLTPPSPARSL